MKKEKTYLVKEPDGACVHMTMHCDSLVDNRLKWHCHVQTLAGEKVVKTKGLSEILVVSTITVMMEWGWGK